MMLYEFHQSKCFKKGFNMSLTETATHSMTFKEKTLKTTPGKLHYFPQKSFTRIYQIIIIN